MKKLIIKAEDLPIQITYNGKEYIIKTAPNVIVLIKKEY